MGIWSAIKDWFGYTPAEEIAKLKEAERTVVNKVDEDIEKTVNEIIDLGKKIEKKIDAEIKVTASKVKKATAKKTAAPKAKKAPAKKK